MPLILFGDGIGVFFLSEINRNQDFEFLKGE